MAFLPQSGGGLFTIDPNATPEQLARKRELLAAMMPQFGNARYVGQGVGQLATGIAMGRQRRQMDKIEGANRDKITDMFDRLFSGGGGSTPPFVASGGSSYTPPDPNSPEGIAGDAMVALGKRSPYADAIASVESAGSGDYKAVGPDTGKGRAYGRYQVMDFNIGPWTEKYLGKRMTPQEFLNDPQAQDAVFNGEFGGYVEKYGNPQDAASMWFSGRPMAQAGNASDGYNTVPQYVDKFNAAMGGTPTATKAGSGMDLKTLAEIAASPYASAGQRTMAQALLQQQMQAMDPNYSLDLERKRLEIDKLRNPQKYAGGAGTVGAQEILDDGTIIQSTPYGPRVFAPDGRELKGQEAAAAVRSARDYTVQNQTEIYRGRRSGTLGADIELGGEAAAVEDIAKASVEAGMGAWESYGKLQTSLANIDDAIAAIDGGAKSGLVYNMLPSVTEASAALESAMNRMGLDVVGAVTFGALSEGELRLALATAVPQNLDPAQLRSWLVKRRDAQAKAAAMAADAAQFLTVPGNTINDWIAKNRGAGRESAKATHRFNPQTGQIEAVQ